MVVLTVERPTPTVVCIPHAGAGASAFETFRTKAGSPFVVIGLPGREASHRERCLTSVPGMADFVANEIAQRELREVVLFGHSLGALVAYEATRRLEGSATTTVRRLVVSGCHAPTSRSSLRLSRLTDLDFLDAVGELGGLPGGLDSAIGRYALPILRADFAAVDAYIHVHGRPLQVPLLVLGSDDDPLVPAREFERWREVAGAACTIEIVPGGHFFIFDHVDWILGLLRS